jgi:hypothetical protein
VNGQCHAPATARKRFGIHCKGGWVGPRANQDWCRKFRPHSIWTLNHPSLSKSLYRLHSPSPLSFHTEIFNYLLNVKANTPQNESYGTGVTATVTTHVSVICDQLQPEKHHLKRLPFKQGISHHTNVNVGLWGGCVQYTLPIHICCKYVTGQVCQFIMSKPVLSHCRYKYSEMTNNIVSICISPLSSPERVQHITVLQHVEQYPAASDHNISVEYSDLVIQKLHTMIYSFKFHVNR